MSWSTILGRSISCPAEQSLDVDQSRQPRTSVDVAAGSGSPPGTRPADTGDDSELDELIRACADTDPYVLSNIGDFGMDADSLDLTVYGVGLRPPDWWSSLADSFYAGSRPAPDSRGGETTTRLPGILDLPSPGPPIHDVRDRSCQQQQQQQHPWAESPAMSSSFDSSLDALGLLPGDESQTFDSGVADEF